MIPWFIAWLALAIPFAWPFKKYEFAGGLRYIDWPLAILFGLLWPVWVFMLIRKRVLEAMLNANRKG